MKYTLAIAGKSRTGSTTLWNALKQHPEICTSKYKENLFALLGEFSEGRRYDSFDKFPYFKYYQPEKFMDMFQTNENTKILFDGSKLALVLQDKKYRELYLDMLDKNKQYISSVKCIYALRDPWECVTSLYKMFARVRAVDPITPGYFYDANGKISKEFALNFIERHIQEYDFINDIIEFCGRENVLFIHTSTLYKCVPDILSFLDIAHMNLKVGHYNKNFIHRVNGKQLRQYFDALDVYKKVVDENKDRLQNVINKNTDKLKEMGITYDTN